jgi:hypothetical protein
MNKILSQSTYESNRDLQTKLVQEIRDFKSQDPFLPFTLVVDNPLQGMMLRRQLIELLAVSEVTAVANLRIVTLDEYVCDLYGILGNQVQSQPSAPVLEASIYALMTKLNTDQNFKPSMSTAMAVAQVYKKIQFIATNAIQELLGTKKLNSTQEMVLHLVLSAREIFSKSQLNSLTAETIIDLESSTPTTLHALGRIAILSKALPSISQDLFSKLEAKGVPVTWHQPDTGLESKVFLGQNRFLVSCPDPATEVSSVVRLLARASSQRRLDRVAVLFADEAQYSGQIQESLINAGINWHGRARTIAQESVVFRTLEILLEAVIDSSDEESGFDRTKLMRLLQNGFLKVDGITLETAQIRKWVRRNELYADAVRWISIIDSFQSERESEDTKLAREHLSHLLKYIIQALTSIRTSSSWEQLGVRLLSAVAEMHQSLEILTDGSSEETAFKQIRLLLERELPLLDELADKDSALRIPIDFGNLLRLLRKKVGARKIRYGKLSSGLHVGQIQDADLLDFDQVYILGLTEGLLPSPEKQDPFLPSELLRLLGEDDLARVSKDNSIASTSISLRMLSSASSEVFLFRPRGGTIEKLQDEPSRYLPEDLNDAVSPSSSKITVLRSLVSSFWQTVGPYSLSPATQADQRLVRQLVSSTPDANFRNVMQAWRSPRFDLHYGNLSESDEFANTVIWSNEFKRPLSSSKIDSYLRCPYEFFVTEVLGFNSNERPDVVINFKPYQFGSYFHKQMELLVKDLAVAGTLPGEAQPWPKGIYEKFMNDYLIRNLGTFISTGKSGWFTTLRSHLEDMSQGLQEFFEVEPSALRTNPDLAIIDAEFSFGNREQTPERLEEDQLIISASDGEKSYRIVGQIDRLDAALDGSAAGIMDFKTGNPDKQKQKLGIEDGTQIPAKVFTLQDVIYRKAVLGLYPNASQVKVTFIFVSAEDGKMFLNADYAHDPNDVLKSTLLRMRQAGESRKYRPTIEEGNKFHDYCRVCSTLLSIPGRIPAEAKIEQTNSINEEVRDV